MTRLVEDSDSLNSISGGIVLNTIGEVLKSRRERLGMTLNELEQRTQLKRHTLEQIENNEFNQLPNSNYTEGFIRKYASVVNIEPNHLIEVHHYWISYLGNTYVVDYCSTIILDKKVLEMRILNEYTKSDNGI